MIDALKVMILEDRAADQELVKRQARKYQPNSVFLVAEDKHTFLEKIDWFLPDLILADYNLPGFTGLDALVYVKEHKPFVPFIFVTGGLQPNDPVANTVLGVADGFVLKENLNSLHLRIGEIMASMQSKIKSQAQSLKKQTKINIKLLKAINLLLLAKDFEQKGELLELFDGLRADLAD